MKGLARLALLLGLALYSCAAVSPPWSTSAAAPDPYLRLNPAQVKILRQAIHDLYVGQVLPARTALADLIGEEPEDLPSALWYQEAQLAWREDRIRRFGASLQPRRAPAAELRDSYREQAEQLPSPLAYFLAARLEEDQLAAKLLFEKALELDPEMVWAHYGLAYSAAREGDWIVARDQLDAVFEREPGHLPSLRLFGWLEAQAGDPEAAIDALEAWVESAWRDYLADERTLDRVRFDLVLAYNSAGHPGRALHLLDELQSSSVEPVRLYTARAVAHQSRDEIAEARTAALAGRRADQTAVLPAVQNALLVELWLKDKVAARLAWQRVIELASRENDLAAGLQQFRAELHLQRLEREAGVVPTVR